MVGRSFHLETKRVDDGALGIYRNCILQALNIYLIMNLELVGDEK